MKTATLREVQHNLARILQWVDEGEEVAISRRRQVIAKIVRVVEPPTEIDWSDQEAWLRKTYASGPCDGSPALDMVLEERDGR